MKKVGAWSIDMQILNWIDTKLGSKSQFVNRILKDAMLDEILRQAKRDQTPRCGQWRVGGCGVCSICLGEGGI